MKFIIIGMLLSFITLLEGRMLRDIYLRRKLAQYYGKECRPKDRSLYAYYSITSTEVPSFEFGYRLNEVMDENEQRKCILEKLEEHIK
jgi:hypothetical protein